MNFISSTYVNQIDKYIFLGADLFTVPWQTNRLWLMHWTSYKQGDIYDR